MKIPDKMNPALVVSTDETRYVINHVCLRDGLLLATDGRRLFAAIPEDSDDEDSRDEVLITPNAIKAAIKKKSEGHYQNEIQIMDKTVIVRSAGEQFVFDDPASAGKEFPKCADVLPDVSKHTIRLALNPTLLIGLAKAMSAEGGVVLHLEPCSDGNLDRPIVVTKSGSSNVVGVLMPQNLKPGSTPSRLTDNHAVKKLEALRSNPPKPEPEPAPQ